MRVIIATKYQLNLCCFTEIGEAAKNNYELI